MAGKVIFMTGDLMDRGVNEFLSEVSAHMIPKPLEIKDVMGAVEAALAARPTT